MKNSKKFIGLITASLLSLVSPLVTYATSTPDMESSTKSDSSVNNVNNNDDSIIETRKENNIQEGVYYKIQLENNNNMSDVDIIMTGELLAKVISENLNSRNNTNNVKVELTKINKNKDEATSNYITSFSIKAYTENDFSNSEFFKNTENLKDINLKSELINLTNRRNINFDDLISKSDFIKYLKSYIKCLKEELKILKEKKANRLSEKDYVTSEEESIFESSPIRIFDIFDSFFGFPFFTMTSESLKSINKKIKYTEKKIGNLEKTLNRINSIKINNSNEFSSIVNRIVSNINNSDIKICNLQNFKNENCFVTSKNIGSSSFPFRSSNSSFISYNV